MQQRTLGRHNIGEVLMRLKDAIDSSKMEMSKFQGALQTLQSQLKDMGYESLDDAETALDDLQQKMEEGEKHLCKRFEVFSKQLDSIKTGAQK
jgi:hypothetical protein